MLAAILVCIFLQWMDMKPPRCTNCRNDINRCLCAGGPF